MRLEIAKPMIHRLKSPQELITYDLSWCENEGYEFDTKKILSSIKECVNKV